MNEQNRKSLTRAQNGSYRHFEMTLSYRYLSVNLDMLEAFGLPKASSLSVLNMSEGQFSDLNARLDVDRFLALLNHAADALQRPNLALHLGHKFRVASFAQTGTIYGYCKNLKDVIRMNGLYQKLAIDAGDIKYLTGANGAHYMSFTPYFSDVEKYRPIIDVVMAAYCTAYRWLSWASGDDILAVELPYTCPENTDGYEEIYHKDIRFESPKLQIEFSDVAIHQELMTYDPEKRQRVISKLDAMLGTQNSKVAFDMTVDTAIHEAINDGHVTSQIVANRIGMTWSAFRTKLKASGIDFRTRVDGVRQKIFQTQYAEGHSFSQIAMALAYNDQAAMNRAFRRWYGMTPTQWKRSKDTEIQIARPQ